ncbi:GNAT family N-acetyltransferase [Oerskovia flava]|uniref:GNAT family N-acetyltransferase n=1 Tax=Oerskovia flava TaxID=2986422 RepID=UPI00223F8EF1|nr:GNAT family N-acetyltransferase [Oerskovia sp. JB1-3-2]
MTHELTDRNGDPVTVGIEPGRPISAYVVRIADGSAVGRVDFIDPPAADHERIVFHTEVDAEFGGRGLAGVLVSAALDDSIRNGLTVVPVCPLFARHLTRHGDEFVARGGVFRKPTSADITVVTRAVRGGA